MQALNFWREKRYDETKLTVSLRTVMKLIRKFFLDSKSVNNLLRSDFVTRLRTPASSTTYDSLGGPSLTTSNSEALASPLGKMGEKLRAKDRARAANPCWMGDNQLLGIERDDDFWGKEMCFLRE